MHLTFKRDSFLSKIFGNVDISDDTILHEAIAAVYRGEQIEVNINDQEVRIKFLGIQKPQHPDGFFKATELCRKGNYAEAIPVFESLREVLKNDSEYYRNYAQAFEETGQYDQAVDLLIESLRYDPKNKWALLLMGNIYVRRYNDLETAYTYFEKVMEVDPKNHIVLANIGGVFLKAGKNNLAERFFKKALESNPNFPNALHGLGILFHQDGNLLEAFDYGNRALRNAENNEQEKVFHGFMTNVASDYVRRGMGKDALSGYLQEVRAMTSLDIRIAVDNGIPSEAKLEVAENYKRDYHLVLYRDNVAFVDHLVAHELTHLKYIEEARKEGLNMLFTSGFLEKKRFKDMMEPTGKKLAGQGLSRERIEGFADMVFHGTNSRIYNSPIDLFIEDHIYRNLPELRPQQFLSLSAIGKLSIQAVTDPAILAATPSGIISKIKVYNALSARQFDDLYSVKTERVYPLSKQEKDLVDQFWEEFNEYRNDRAPGEEYELIQNWGRDLDLDRYFKLKEEVLDRKEDDPLHNRISELLGNQVTEEVNHEVVRIMVKALEYFNSRNEAEIEAVAFETAMKAKGGINQDITGLSLDSVPGKQFTGQEVLVYYYVSWALIKPEYIGELGLDYGREFEIAKSGK
ncbi:hypothetical protein EF405_19090 [Cyclobacteriaceae bacterium YHN15]|nr:hypothetical protein EF405_19090 [Cyclobacteriaceae bacterium YHN15]